MRLASSSMIASWNTRDALTPDFEARWNAFLASTPQANFVFDLRYLLDEARQERHSIATVVRSIAPSGIVDAGFIVTESAGRIRCGSPWRLCYAPWSISPRARIETIGRPVTLFHANDDIGYLAGATIVRPIDMSDAELLLSLDGNRRRAMTRARKAGYAVHRASRDDEFRAFHQLQGLAAFRLDLDPEGWREWLRPWMALLVATHDGRVEGGSGFGFIPGGMMDYRTNASTDAARRAGINVLLAYEAMRLGRDLGCRWMNWCGANRFKRELGGEVVPIHCLHSGGNAAQRLAGDLATRAHRFRGALVRMKHAIERRAA